MKLKAIISTILFINSGFVCADSAESYENRFSSPIRSPLGCKDTGYQFDLNVVKIKTSTDGDRQSLYFIYNKLGQTVKLYQMQKSTSTRKTFLNHEIRPNKWSVLATGEKELQYICAVNDSHSKFGRVVSCAKSLKICEYTRVKFGLNNRGNYWIVNSASRGGAVGGVVRYGIIPR